MRLEVLKYLADMLHSLSVLEDYRHSAASLETLRQNQMLSDALERRLSIIGEALYQANKLDKDILITDKKKIMGLRYILVHDYDKVKPEMLYVIITKSLDLLKQELEIILKANPPQGALALDD